MVEINGYYELKKQPLTPNSALPAAMKRQYAHAYPETPAIAQPEPHGCRRFVGKTVLLTAATKGVKPLPTPAKTIIA